MLTMPATLVTRGYPPRTVASTVPGLLLKQCLVRLTLVQALVDDLNDESPAWRSRLFLYDCHRPCPR